MLMFTPNQLQDIMDIIDKHHSMFITTNIGTNYLSQFERRTLEDAGLDLSKFEGTNGKVEEAYSFGVLTAALGDKRSKDMDYQDFRKFVYSKNFLPLTKREESTVDHLKYQIHSDVKYLNDKIKSDVSNIALNQDKIVQSKLGDITREAAINTVEMRGSVRDMISEIGHKTGQWESNLGRIAEYTLHNAYEEGRAAQFEKEHGEGVKVYKDVYPGACKHCIRHYLTAGLGSQPVIFTLAQLKENGSNVGKKVDQWQPTLGSLHPHCRCTVNEIPEGFGWDKEKGKFIKEKYVPKNAKVANRKKILVKIGDKDIMV